MAGPEDGTTSRRTGVVRGRDPRAFRRAGRHNRTGLDWLAIGILALLAAVAGAWLLAPGRAPDDRAKPSAPAVAGSSPGTSSGPSTNAAASPGAAAASTKPSPTEETTEPPIDQPTDEPTDEPTLEPTLEPTDEPTLEPTFEPTPTDEPVETPVPTPPTATAFTIDSIGDGEKVAQQTIDISGAAPVGMTVTRDVPMWFDDHVAARATGRWTMRVGLTEGVNELRFRLADDRSTEVLLHVTYQPGR